MGPRTKPCGSSFVISRREEEEPASCTLGSFRPAVSESIGSLIWKTNPIQNFDQKHVIHSVKFFSQVNEQGDSKFSAINCLSAIIKNY